MEVCTAIPLGVWGSMLHWLRIDVELVKRHRVTACARRYGWSFASRIGLRQDLAEVITLGFVGGAGDFFLVAVASFGLPARCAVLCLVAA